MSKGSNSPTGGAPRRDPEGSLVIVPSTPLEGRAAGTGGVRGGKLQQGITARLVLNAARQWWKMAVPAGLALAGVAGALVWVLVETKYQASAWLQVKEQAPYLAFNEDRSKWERYVGTQAELIKNPLVLTKALEARQKRWDGEQWVELPELIKALPDFQEAFPATLFRRERDEVQWLRKNLRVEPQKGSEFLLVSLAGSNANDAAAIVNAVLQEYVNLQGRDDKEEGSRIIELLEKEKSERLRRDGPIARAREEVRRLAKEATGREVFAPWQNSEAPAENPPTETYKALLAAEVDGEVLKARLKVFEESYVWLGCAGTTAGGGSATIRPAGENNDLVIKPGLPDSASGAVSIRFAAAQGAGKVLAKYDEAERVLSIAIDPASTTANEVIAAVNATGSFTAELDATADLLNDGTGLIGKVGNEAASTLPAALASGRMTMPGDNNDLVVTARQAGPSFDNKRVFFVCSGVTGDQAVATFDQVAGTLTIGIDPAATTANAVIKAVEAEGTFVAQLDTTVDRANNGTGMISKRQVEVSDAFVEEAVQGDPEVQRMVGQLSAKRRGLREIESKSVKGKQDSFYRQLENEIAQDEKTLHQVCGDLRRQVKAAQQLAAIGSLRDLLASKQAEFAGLSAKERALRARYENQLKQLQQYGGETLELVFAKAELDRAQQVVDSLEKRIAELRTEQRAPTRVMLRYPATPPKSGSPPWMLMFLAMSAAFCAPFALAAGWERIVRRVTDVAQLEEHSSLGVVGEVARLPVRARGAGASLSSRVGRDVDVFEESIDTLRTCLILSESLRDMKVLAVTSGTNREGKTSVAVQLALSIARASGAPTLLIDGDMRSPDVHHALETSVEPGLADVLAHRCGLKEAIVTDLNEDMHFLPAGRIDTSPHKLLGNGVLRSLLDEARASYRYIIVDTPPVLAAAEALILASAADASLICAMRGVSRLDQVKRAHERLVAAGARPVGVVLNGIPAKRYAYRYGTYAQASE